MYVYSGVYGKLIDEHHYAMDPLEVIEAQILVAHKTLNGNMLP